MAKRKPLNFETKVKALLQTPLPPSGTAGRRKTVKPKTRKLRRPAPGGEALVRSVTVKPKASTRKATKKR